MSIAVGAKIVASLPCAPRAQTWGGLASHSSTGGVPNEAFLIIRRSQKPPQDSVWFPASPLGPTTLRALRSPKGAIGSLSSHLEDLWRTKKNHNCHQRFVLRKSLNMFPGPVAVYAPKTSFALIPLWYDGDICNIRAVLKLWKAIA